MFHNHGKRRHPLNKRIQNVFGVGTLEKLLELGLELRVKTLLDQNGEKISRKNLCLGEWLAVQINDKLFAKGLAVEQHPF
jgi:hypothetical protein